MTCRGYDSKSVKVSKTVKRAAGTFIDPHQRGAFIRSYVKVLETSTHQRSRSRGDKDGE